MTARLAAFTVVIALLWACGSDEAAPAEAGVSLDVIDDALAAVDADVPGRQQYFEVTANAQLVRLFVADEQRSQVTTYLYVDGQVTVSGEPEPATGFTFAASNLSYDPDTMLDDVGKELPDAVVEEFSIVGTEGGAPRYAAFVRSERGGRLDVVLSAAGEVLEVGPAAELPVPATS